jgi:hypothetical protein
VLGGPRSGLPFRTKIPRRVIALHGFCAWQPGSRKSYRAKTSTGLIAAMSQNLPKRAEAVLSAEKRVRERLVVEAQLVAAGAGLRLQRSAFWVAVLAFLMATAAVVVGVVQLSK